VLSGDPDYGTDEAHQWPRAWYGVKGYFKWLESKAYKMHVRVLLSRYRAYSQCPACGGARLQPDALLYRLATGPVPRQANAGATIAELPRPAGLSLADFYALPVDRALAVVQEVGAASGAAAGQAHSSIAIVLEEIRTRLSYLVQVGLGYLTLDRPTRTLSGGETERVNLTTCLGTRLVNTLFVLDEPSVGLHPRDTARLVGILERLRDTGNSVIVVEHEASVMRAADQIVDLGPGHGATGGEVIFQGPFREILKSAASLTGQYLSGRRRIEIPERRAVGSFVFLADRLTDHEPIGGASSTSPALQLNSGLRGTPSSEVRFMGSPQSEIRNPKGRKGSVPKQVRESTTDATPHSALRTPHLNWLTVEHATRHNLRDLSVALPLNRFVCLTGVSGSGKTTFAREVLLPALQERLETARPTAKACDRLDSATEPETEGDAETDSATRLTHCLTGAEHLARVLLVDQAALGKTPRSNPAVYVGAFEDIREVFAQTEAARQRGLNASAFSFNSAQGQCERCRGAGFEKIEMQFLSDVFIRCPDCGGRRYRQHILEVRVQPPASKVRAPKSDLPGHPGPRRRAAEGLSIADLLEATVDEALEFLAGFAGSKPAARACAALRLLQDVGLGYLHLGQPINTLSGGESQRLKLAAHLAEATQGRTSVAPVPVAIYEATPPEGPGEDGGRRDACPTLFIFDEPTTGLHFDDIRVLLEVFQRLVRNGHSVLVIEHNLEVIKCADWVIDLGPEAGEGGGQLVAAGTPEQIAACAASHTGQFLRTVLNPAST
jgi:excinuclease ABC subunit A